MLQKLNLQKSYDKVKLLTIIQFILVIFAFIFEAVATKSVFYFSFIFQFTVLIVAYNFYYRALSNLFYSFWNMSFVLSIYYLVSMIRNFAITDHHMIAALFLVSIILMSISCYMISSPLYYPLFNWWEYDFRFRADIKCVAEVDGKPVKGRLSDLRRGAACLELFDHLTIGNQVQINLEVLNQNFTLFAEVRSKREPIIGRSIIYGVKFVNNDLEQKQRLKLLTNYWRESKKIKIRNKFAAVRE